MLITIMHYDIVNGTVMFEICTVPDLAIRAAIIGNEFRGDEFDEVFRSYVKIARSH
jgi:hypothetical protein